MLLLLWKRILKRVFSACGQLLKATYSERNWPLFKRTCKEQILCLKEETTQSSASLEKFFEEYSHDLDETGTQQLKKRTTIQSSQKKRNFQYFILFFSSYPPNSFFFSNMTVLWTCFNFYDLFAWKVSTGVIYDKGWRQATLSVNPFCFRYSRFSRSSFPKAI